MSDSPKLHAAGLAAGYARHRFTEWVTRPRPRSIGEVPASPSALTRQWLTEALCGEVPGAQVLAFETDTDSAGTTNRCGLDLTYNPAGIAAGLPGRVFAKFTTGLTSRLILGLTGVIQGEINFYTRVRPLIDLSAPASYFGAYDLASGRTVLLMEDIAHSRGAQFLEPVDHLSLPEARSQLDVLAALHAAMWERHDLAIEGLHRPLDRLNAASAMVGLEKRLMVGVERSLEVLPAAFVDRRSDIWPALVNSLQLCAQGPQTVLHGDPHLGNFYRAGDGMIGACDWQMIATGSWSFDVGYAITNALRVQDRREWEERLVRHYVERLADGGGPSLDFDAAWLGYRQQPFWGMNAWLATIGRSFMMPKMQPDENSLAELERITHAIVDLGSFDAVL